MEHAPIPQFLVDTLETMSFGRRAGEWDFKLAARVHQAPSECVLAAFFDCFPWASLRDSPTNAIPGPTEQGWSAGELGESDLPCAGKLTYDRIDSLVFLTIWPNLFTDTVPTYRQRPDGFHPTHVRWTSAAQRNRQRLATSLVCWQKNM